MWHKKAAGKELPKCGYCDGSGGLRPRWTIFPIFRSTLPSLSSRKASTRHWSKYDEGIPPFVRGRLYLSMKYPWMSTVDSRETEDSTRSAYLTWLVAGSVQRRRSPFLTVANTVLLASTNGFGGVALLLVNGSVKKSTSAIATSMIMMFVPGLLLWVVLNEKSHKAHTNTAKPPMTNVKITFFNTDVAVIMACFLSYPGSIPPVWFGCQRPFADGIGYSFRMKIILFFTKKVNSAGAKDSC